jgi:hypothetical protein
MSFQHHSPNPPLARTLVAGALTLVSTGSAFSGEVKTPSVRLEKKAAPLLSFYDGRVAFDVEERTRYEVRSDTRDFNDASNDANDDSWLVHRFRLGVRLKPAKWLNFYLQGQDTREWDSDRANIPGVTGTEGGDTFDLRQGYLELGDLKRFPLSLTLGRQSLIWGDGRLVGDPRWNNFGRTFDAVKLRFESKGFWADAFVGRPVQIKEEVFNDSDSADTLAGLYAGTEAVPIQSTEFFFFYRDKRDTQPDLDPTNRLDPRGSWNGPAQRTATIGTRMDSEKGALNGWDYKLVAAAQWGDLWLNDRSAPALDQRAYAVHVSGGYTWEEPAWHPRIGLEYNFASGDKNPNDGKSESFQNLFPSNHEKYGYLDEFSWRNLHNIRVQTKVDVTRSIQAELNYHAFWLADTHDYWYRSNGFSTLRTRTPDGRDVRTVGARSFAGHEIDFVVRWNASKWLTLDTGYTHFFAGDYLRDTGPADDADFAYVQAQLAF